MSILDDILRALGLGPKTTPAPAPKPAPKPAAPHTAPPAQTGTATLQLSSLKAQNASPVGSAEIEAAAARLGVESRAIKAIMQVESANQGFGADGRPIILFEPTEFSELTNRRFDSGHPNVSMATAKSGAIGATQADRWAKLTEAYGLDQAAALKATSWGLFQISGESFAVCGYPNVFAMVQDLAKTESRQLAAFEAYVKAKGLAASLNAQDWEGFARVYGGHASAETIGKAIAGAYAGGGAPTGGGDFLVSLKAKNAAPLSSAEVNAAAQRMGCEPAAVRAVLKVESKGTGFGADNRPLILYEPHIFSRLTNHVYDQSHPKISYLNWKTLPYPGTQAERYQQLAEAYALDPENAVASASWGLFQIMGMNYAACGFPSAKAFVADISQSEARMLAAFEAFVRSNNLLDELQRKDWAGFARGYNGAGQVDTYSKLLANAYAAASAQV
jgi:hypothetical protein